MMRAGDYERDEQSGLILPRRRGVLHARPQFMSGPAFFGGGDPYLSSVQTLLHLEGSNGSSTYVDSSTFGRAFSAVGTGRISTAGYKFGAASANFAGNTSNAIRSTAANVAHTAQSAAYTMECWIYPTAFNANGGRIASAGGGTVAWNSTAGIHWLLQIGASGASALSFQWWNGTTNATINTTISLSSWAHVAATYDLTTVRLFVNGSVAGSLTSTWASPSTTPFLSLGEIYGETGGVTQSYTGYLDEFRTTKGVARYTAAFTAPSAPFQDY